MEFTEISVEELEESLHLEMNDIVEALKGDYIFYKCNGVIRKVSRYVLGIFYLMICCGYRGNGSIDIRTLSFNRFNEDKKKVTVFSSVVPVGFIDNSTLVLLGLYDYGIDFNVYTVKYKCDYDFTGADKMLFKYKMLKGLKDDVVCINGDVYAFNKVIKGSKCILKADLNKIGDFSDLEVLLGGNGKGEVYKCFNIEKGMKLLKLNLNNCEVNIKSCDKLIIDELDGCVLRIDSADEVVAADTIKNSTLVLGEGVKKVYIDILNIMDTSTIEVKCPFENVIMRRIYNKYAKIELKSLNAISTDASIEKLSQYDNFDSLIMSDDIREELMKKLKAHRNNKLLYNKGLDALELYGVIDVDFETWNFIG